MNKNSQSAVVWLISLAAFAMALIALLTRFSYTTGLASNASNRTLGTAFMVSDQRPSVVSYNVLVTNSATVVAGNSGQVQLQKKTGVGAWTTISTGQSTVGSGVVFTGAYTQSVFGVIGIADSVRIISVNLVGTPTYGQPSGVEIQLN